MHRSRMLIAALLAMTMVGTIACGQTGTPSGAPAGSAAPSGSGAAGVSAAPAASEDSSTADSVTVWTTDSPDFNWPKYLLDDFTKETGIAVDFQAMPTSDQQTKVGVALTTQSAPFDATIFPMGAAVTQTPGLLDLKPFIDDPVATPDEYNYEGIPPSQIAPCTYQGAIYCLPANLDPGPMLYYNKEILAEAGLTAPPEDWNQVLEYAKKVHSDEHAGICMQGSEASPNGYPVLQMIPYFLPASPENKSGYLGPDWKPLWDTPGAKQWASIYAPLMQSYAPVDVSAYDGNDCVRAFQNGEVAMLFANALEAARLYGSENPNAAKVGIKALPCPPSNQECIFSVPFAFFINKFADPDRQKAAWEFIRYMTSAAPQLKALQASGNPNVGTRPETLKYAIDNASSLKVPKDYLEAVAYSSEHIVPNPIPPTPAFGKTQSTLFVILSKLITKQVTEDQALEEMQVQMTDALKEAGLIQ